MAPNNAAMDGWSPVKVPATNVPSSAPPSRRGQSFPADRKSEIELQNRKSPLGRPVSFVAWCLAAGRCGMMHPGKMGGRLPVPRLIDSIALAKHRAVWALQWTGGELDTYGYFLNHGDFQIDGGTTR